MIAMPDWVGAKDTYNQGTAEGPGLGSGGEAEGKGGRHSRGGEADTSKMSEVNTVGCLVLAWNAKPLWVKFNFFMIEK